MCSALPLLMAKLGNLFSYTVILWLLKASSLAPFRVQERLPIPVLAKVSQYNPRRAYKSVGKTAVCVYNK